MFLLLKAGHSAYYRFRDIDNVIFCPSENEIIKARESWIKTQGMENPSEDPRIKNIFQICKRCPDNGHCDIYGDLKCNGGYIRIGRECMFQSEQNQMGAYYGQAIYYKYLHYLGSFP